LKLITHELAALVEQSIRSAQAAGELPAFDVETALIEVPKRPEHGDYATAVAIRLAKPAKMNPHHIATQIANHMPQADFVSAVEVVHPGYINFRLSEAWLKSQVDAIIAEGEALFTLDIGSGKRAQVEFVSANPSGPITIGRSRGGVIGDTMARVLDAAGYAVEREYYFNNAGKQMRDLGNSLRVRYLGALGQPVEIPGEDEKWFYRGEYLIDFGRDIAAEYGDSLVNADWQPFKDYAEKRMFNWIKTTLARVQIHHDVFFNENSLYESGAIWEILEALDEKGYVYKASIRENASPEDIEETGAKGEAVWFRSTALGDQEDRVLVKSTGEPTYTLPDIAYHVNKFERNFDLMVNILGSDHYTEYQVVQYALRLLGYDTAKLNVILNQMVRTMQNGQEVRMSTRRGVFDTLDDLIDLTSADAVRYLLLNRTPSSHLLFDIDLAVKQTNENPVYYIQNAHVRCAGIFREAAARGVSDDGADISLLGEDELTFIRKALRLGEEIELAAANYEPHRIAFYALELARVFHPIYDSVRALHGDVPPELAKARLRFYRAAKVVFKRVLTLMGMTAPETM
jgi:arginyl-tRNA synthetase